MEIPAVSPTFPLELGGVPSAAQRQPDHEAARAAGEESDQRDVLNVFERAREALMAQVQLAPAVADVLTMPSPTTSLTAPEAPAPVALQLAMHDGTRVVVRLTDLRTGAVLREMPSTAVAVLAARIGRVVRGRSAKALMR